MLGKGEEDRILGCLLESGLITKAQQKAAQAETGGAGSSPLENLVNSGALSEQDLIVYLSKEYNIPITDVQNCTIAPEVLDKIPYELAKRYSTIPLTILNATLTLAMVNPLDPIVIDDLTAFTGMKIKAVFGVPSHLKEVMEKVYGQETRDEDVDVNSSMREIVDDLDNVEWTKSGGSHDAVDLGSEDDEILVVKVVNLLILESIQRKASDVFMEPWEQTMRVRCRVDGLLEEIRTLPSSMSQPVVSRIKVMSNLDIAERRLPQDGRFKARISNREIDFRVSILPTQFGEKVCIRLLDKKGQSQSLESLGFEADQFSHIKKAAKAPYGMILVTGPTGSGKTTTLYAVLNMLHNVDTNITTVEEPVEYQVHGINQVNVREGVGLTFSSALRSILRQDPDIVMIGEIRDGETMDIATKAALTGHLVLSTLHTNDAASSVVRMVNMGIEPFLICASVIVITAQRLVRRLCDNCKEPIALTDKVRKMLKVEASSKVQIYAPGKCQACRNTGYAGRCVITEVLPLTRRIQSIVLQRGTGDDVKAAAREEGMRTLRESGFLKVIQGLTTTEEVLRVTAADREDATDE